MFGLSARLQAISHKILHPLHKVKWRVNVDDICPGDIECITCQIIFWCRIASMNTKQLNKALNNEGPGFWESYGVAHDPGSTRKVLTEQDKNNIIESVRQGG